MLQNDRSNRGDRLGTIFDSFSTLSPLLPQVTALRTVEESRDIYTEKYSSRELTISETTGERLVIPSINLKSGENFFVLF